VIPPFDDHGYLPPGVHPATLDEVAARFGQGSELRRVQMESLRWLIDAARRAGVERVIVNGSFVSDVPEPNDVDCALLIAPDFPRGAPAVAELHSGFPFVQLELVTQANFDLYVRTLFATDRSMTPKGMVEVLLWT
jgi:hypothetical protein